MSEETERARFEVAAACNDWISPDYGTRKMDGLPIRYLASGLQKRWEAWQARADHDIPTGGEPAEMAPQGTPGGALRGDAGTAQWVSVEDRLPDANGEFLIVETADKEASTADFRKDTAQWWTVRSFGQDCEERELYSVTHWMELPSVPEAAAEGTKSFREDATTKNPRPDGTDCCGCLKFGPPPLGFQKCPCSCHWLAFIESPIARELLSPEEDSAPLRKSKTEKGNMSNIQKENEPVGAFRGDARTIVCPSCQATDNNAYTDAARETPSEEVKMLREQTAAYRRESLARVARRETGRTLCKRCKGSGCVPLDAYRNPKTRKCPDCKGTGADSMAHREGEQDAGTRMYEPHTRVLELYYAQKDGCKTHPIGCGKICLECVADELTERESAWRKEREALRDALEGLRHGTTWMQPLPASKEEPTK